MPFTREWDGQPRVWARWEEDGVSWRVQDLPPEDDEEALGLLLDDMLNDEVLCSYQKCAEDEAAVRDGRLLWSACLARRCSLGCYRAAAGEGGRGQLVALNVCYVKCKDDEEDNTEYESHGWRQVLYALDHVEKLAGSSASGGGDLVLCAMGLVVRRDHRGRRLGARILDAREAMCRALGVPATVTVFTGPASQRLAAGVGFRTLAEASFADLAKAGLDYPAEHARVIKIMIKTYDHADGQTRNDA